jgi:hypothetical protein
MIRSIGFLPLTNKAAVMINLLLTFNPVETLGFAGFLLALLFSFYQVIKD